MESQRKWGMVVFAGVFAVLIVGVAATTLFSSEPAPVTKGEVAPSNEAREQASWQNALSAIVPAANASSTGPYRAPKELPLTEVVGRELFAGYLEAKADGKLTAAEQQQLIEDILARNVEPVKPPVAYTLNSIKTSATLPYDQYTSDLVLTLRKSEEVQEYELTTFSRTFGKKNYNGTPELKAAASNYKSIEESLAGMTVPTAVGPEHVALLQAVSFLAESVRLMGNWSGDPILALAYVDAFNRSERAVTVATSNLFLKISKTAKKP